MTQVIMPKMGDAMTEGKVVRWYKKAGDAIRKGEPVLEIETDKVNLDLFWLKDDSLEDSANLPDPGVLALEITEDLEAALAQFAEISSDLNVK